MARRPLWEKVRSLREAGDTQGLIAVLNGPISRDSPRLRSHIVWELSQSSEPGVTKALMTTLRCDPNERVRVEAAAVLAGRGGDDVESVFLEALSDANRKIRIHAARGLARARGQQVVSALESALGDQDTVVRRTAAESLGRNAAPEVVAPLTNALGDNSVRVRLTAARALSQIGATGALPAMRRARDRTWPPWRLVLSRDIEHLEQRYV